MGEVVVLLIRTILLFSLRMNSRGFFFLNIDFISDSSGMNVVSLPFLYQTLCSVCCGRPQKYDSESFAYVIVM